MILEGNVSSQDQLEGDGERCGGEDRVGEQSSIRAVNV